MSTPWSKGLKRMPADQVLSSATGIPCSCAAAAIAATSCTSIVIDPGLSHQTRRVFDRILDAIAAPSSGS
jgi:hypothetical protein